MGRFPSPHLEAVISPSLEALEFHHGPGFGDHGSRVARLALAVGCKLGFSEREITRLRFAALIHDVGKVEIPPSILEKPTPLDEAEHQVIRRHPEVGYARLDGAVHRQVAEAVLAHHEWWDGTGYPHGLRRTGIPTLARTIFVADSFDVMTTGRSYRPGMSVEKAGHELQRLAGRQFDPEVVDAFASLDSLVLAPPALAGPDRSVG